MTRLIFPSRRLALASICTAALWASVGSPVWAAGEPAPTAAAPAIPPNPAAAKAVEQRFHTVFAALDGKAAALDAQLFTDDFNQHVSPAQMRQVFQQLHQEVGKCHISGRMRSPVPVANAYLLQCNKAFVPMEISVEDKAPYRIQSLVIRPGFWK